MQADKYELGKKMILLSSQYRNTGDKLSVDAYTQLIAKAITKKEYDEIHDKVGILFAQAIAINKEIAAWTAGSIEADLNGIESATKDLKKAAARIAKVRDIVNVVVDVCTTIGTLVLASTTPTPASIATAIKATIAITQEINEMTAA
jgi:hypothetical protein